MNTNYVWYISGALSAYHAPEILQTLKANFGTPKAIIVSKAALNFTSVKALKAIGHCRVVVNGWHEFEKAEISHVDIVDPNSIVLCYPATLNTISKFSIGDCSSPFLLALQCSQAQIVFAPALPPGGHESFVFQNFRKKSEKTTRIHVLPTVPVKSAASVHLRANAIPSMWTVVNFLKDLLSTS